MRDGKPRNLDLLNIEQIAYSVLGGIIAAGMVIAAELLYWRRKGGKERKKALASIRATLQKIERDVKSPNESENPDAPVQFFTYMMHLQRVGVTSRFTPTS